MSYTVQFDNVSKKYRLGMTRSSLPNLLVEFSKSVMNRGRQNEARRNLIHWAVKNVNFDMRAGESMALIGPNGAGKTTILKLLAQITKPTTGNIKVNGKLSALIELGAGFHPDLSGRENIYLNGVILGLKREEIRNLYDEIVEFSELEHFMETPLKRYSSGMAVRLGFAVAASIKPDILLVDEVLAVGDASFRLKCVQRIEKLLQHGTSLIFVSHNMDLVKAVCEKSIYLDHGQAIYFGNTNEAVDIYNRALNERRIQQFSASEGSQDTSKGFVEITEVKIVGQNDTPNASLTTTQPARIDINYISYDDIADSVIVLRIIRTDGISCSVLYSNLDNVHFSIKKGAGNISVRLEPLQLFPGVYYVAATLKSANEAITFSIGRSDWFEVKGKHHGYQDRDAVFEPNHQWEHQVDLEAGAS